ncbi:hypothetical protein EJ02DRAFT_422047 [Clathrospora elynae]|uniref:Uncharacterized protein n=1 Tax=Clathrospora elynae TaxID=706981 RepID=A0A6A5SRE9_9PLEO|nr:hypothetical protein EJ02DRAFT_422047 [Clathrospora elynae]
MASSVDFMAGGTASGRLGFGSIGSGAGNGSRKGGGKKGGGKKGPPEGGQCAGMTFMTWVHDINLANRLVDHMADVLASPSLLSTLGTPPQMPTISANQIFVNIACICVATVAAGLLPICCYNL